MPSLRKYQFHFCRGIILRLRLTIRLNRRRMADVQRMLLKQHDAEKDDAYSSDMELDL